MKITVQCKDTIITVDELDGKADDKTTLRWADQKEAVIEVLKVMTEQVKKLI
jgi:hypothetical protein